MGHKLHMDQNEKLVMSGVTHVIAVDGYSKKIVANVTMPVKKQPSHQQRSVQVSAVCSV